MQSRQEIFCAPNKRSPFILCCEKDDGMNVVPWGRVGGIYGNVVGCFVCLFVCLFNACIFLILTDKKPFQLIVFSLTLQGLFREVC